MLRYGLRLKIAAGARRNIAWAFERLSRTAAVNVHRRAMRRSERLADVSPKIVDDRVCRLRVTSVVVVGELALP